VNREGEILYDLSKVFDNELLIPDKHPQVPLIPIGDFEMTKGLNSFSIVVFEAVSGLMRMFDIPYLSIDRSRYLDIVRRHISKAPILTTIPPDLLEMARNPRIAISMGKSGVGMGKALIFLGKALQSGVLGVGIIPSKYAHWIQILQRMVELAKEWSDTRDVYAALLVDSVKQNEFNLSCLINEERSGFAPVKSMHHTTWYILGYSMSAAIVEAAEKIELYLHREQDSE